MANLVLASTSPYRRDLLRRLGLPFETADPQVDEAALEQAGDPIATARGLALAKTESAASAHKKAIVIGCDQVCALGSEILGKPGDRAGAIAQLARLAGQEHALITAVALAHKGGPTEFVDVTMLRMRPLATAEIERYVDLDEPYDCAGSYRIERAGIALFDRIQGEDHTAIVGLPLLKLSAALRELGLPT
jgi:septum formation protein